MEVNYTQRRLKIALLGCLGNNGANEVKWQGGCPPPMLLAWHLLAFAINSWHCIGGWGQSNEIIKPVLSVGTQVMSILRCVAKRRAWG